METRPSPDLPTTMPSRLGVSIVANKSKATQAARSTALGEVIERPLTSNNAHNLSSNKVEDEVPSFFGVCYETVGTFRIAVEKSVINIGMHLVQAHEIHSSTRPAIKCKYKGCKFLVFGRLKNSKKQKGVIAVTDDTITTKEGKVLKQCWNHSGACKLCPTSGGRGKLRRVLDNEDIISTIRASYRDRNGKTAGMLQTIAQLAQRLENHEQLSKTTCHRIKTLILDVERELQRESFKFIPRFLEEFEKKNEGSLTNLTTKRDGSFKAMFVSFPVNINAARLCGLRVTAIDAAHSYNELCVYHVVEYSLFSSMKKNMRLCVAIVEGFERNFTYEYVIEHATAAGITTWSQENHSISKEQEKTDMDSMLAEAARNIQLARDFYKDDDTSVLSPKRSDHLLHIRKLQETMKNILLHESQKDALAIARDDLAAYDMTSVFTPPEGQRKINHNAMETVIEENRYKVGDSVFMTVRNSNIYGTVLTVHDTSPLEYDVEFHVTEEGTNIMDYRSTQLLGSDLQPNVTGHQVLKKCSKPNNYRPFPDNETGVVDIDKYCAFCNELLEQWSVESRTMLKTCNRCLAFMGLKKVILFTDQGKAISRFLEGFPEDIRPLQVFCSEHLLRTLRKTCNFRHADRKYFYRAAKSSSHVEYLQFMRDIARINEEAADYLWAIPPRRWVRYAWLELGYSNYGKSTNNQAEQTHSTTTFSRRAAPLYLMIDIINSEVTKTEEVVTAATNLRNNNEFLTPFGEEYFKLYSQKAKGLTHVQVLGDTCVTVATHGRARKFSPTCHFTAAGDIVLTCASCHEFREFGVACSHLIKAWVAKFHEVFLKKQLSLDDFMVNVVDPAYLVKNVCCAFNDNTKVICPTAFECVERRRLCLQPRIELPVRRGRKRVTRFPSQGEEQNGKKKGRTSKRKKFSDDTDLVTGQEETTVSRERDDTNIVTEKGDTNPIIQQSDINPFTQETENPFTQQTEYPFTQVTEQSNTNIVTVILQQSDTIPVIQEAVTEDEETIPVIQEPETNPLDQHEETIIVKELFVGDETKLSDLTDRATEQQFKFLPLTTKQPPNENNCFSIALLIGQEFIDSTHTHFDMKNVQTIINSKASQLGRLMRDERNMKRGDHIDFKDGLQDCTSIGVLRGEMVPRHVPSPDSMVVHPDPQEDYYHRYMIAVSGEIDNKGNVESLIQCLLNVRTHCYCILGVSFHYVAITKSDTGEFSLYESLDYILNDDEQRGGVLTSNAEGAVDMVMHYGQRRKLRGQEVHKCFDAAIIKPSEVRASKLDDLDWIVFYGKAYSRARGNQQYKRLNLIGGHRFTLHDFKKLQPGIWLNDGVINSFFTLLASRDTKQKKRTHFMDTHWLLKLGLDDGYSYEGVKRCINNVPGGDFFSLKQIIVPVNRGNDHWMCLCVDVENHEIYSLDSMEHNEKNKQYLSKCMESMERFLVDEWKRKKGRKKSPGWKVGTRKMDPVPQQMNGFDCGVFLCAYGECLSRGVSEFDFTQDDMLAYRMKIGISLLGNEHFHRLFGDSDNGI